MNSQISVRGNHFEKAYVVFTGDADLWWLKLLKKSFRHCFILLNDGEHWITVDPLSCFTEITISPALQILDLPAWYSKKGMIVIPVPIYRHERRPMWPSIFSCVEVAKNILGLRAPFVLTPWQLYRRLQKISQLR